jgi:hypothetical protein
MRLWISPCIVKKFTNVFKQRKTATSNIRKIRSRSLLIFSVWYHAARFVDQGYVLINVALFGDSLVEKAKQ